MYVARLALTDFRNYDSADLALVAGPTVFVGPNGQGKTNLVEAMGYAASLRSHRVASDAPLVRRGASEAFIHLDVVRGERRARLDMQIRSPGANVVRLNGNPLTRARDSFGLLRLVMFAPEDLSLVKGDPAGRRRFLDDLLAQRLPRFGGVRAEYERALKQRNALLKAIARQRRALDETDRHTLHVWDEALARHGGQLLAGRVALLDQLAGPVARAYGTLSGSRDEASLNYRSDAAPEWLQSGDHSAAGAEVELGESLRRRHEEELRRGVSLVGPHLDDLDLLLESAPARGYASHGESWSFALALRLGSYALLSSESVDSGEPVLVLDDVFAELDAQRRARLAEEVSSAEQVLITAAVAEDVPAHLRGRHISIEAGRIAALGDTDE